jgi:hypothetical protein
MENFEIKDYLENLDRLTSKGACKTCAKPIHWSRESVRGHKRKACPNSTEEDRTFLST